MQAEKLSGKVLKTIAEKSPTATRVTMSLALRARLRHFSDVNRIKSELVRAGEKIVDADFNQYWKDLDKAGVGSIIYGRKGKSTRFEWFYSLKSVAKAAIEGKDLDESRIVPKKGVKVILKKNPINTITFETPEVKEKAKETPKPSLVVNDTRVFIVLRPDFQLEINLPSDVTPREVELIKLAITRSVN